MHFTDSDLQRALTEWRALTDAKERSAADNIWFEQRVSSERQQAFENGALGVRDVDDLRKRHVDYWKEYVQVDNDIAHTFDVTLAPVDLGSIDQTQRIIRIEELSGRSGKWPRLCRLVG
jgi:hypothetical protein